MVIGGRSIRLPRAVARIYPFKSHFMNFKEFAYHYLDEGDGDPVIMLHGNPTWSFFYRELVKSLSPAYRVLVPDHIGCGLSDKPPATRYGYQLRDRVNDLARFIDQLNLDRRITLVLHDWGGMIGMAWAIDHVERVGRIIILNTASFLPPGGKRLPRRIEWVRNLKHLAPWAVLGLNLFAVAAVYTAPCRPLSADIRAGYLAPYNRPANRIATLKFVQDIPLVESDPSYAMVSRVQAKLHLLSEKPMLVCWGGRDFVFDRDYLSEWQRRFPHAQTHLFDDAGHYVLEDASEWIIHMVRSFLQKKSV
jgi:haloalkane dehalogenase